MATTLTVDVSNTITSLVLWHDEVADQHWRISTDPHRTADELRVLLGALLDEVGLAAVEDVKVALASVVPAAAKATRHALRRLIGEPALEIGPGVRSGLRIRTEDPREVGPDRVANAVAAVAGHGGPVIVLDFATAVTLDVVDAECSYRGAVIAPGMEAAMRALSARTARLGAIEPAAPRRAIASNTIEALHAGAVFGFASMVEGLLAGVRAEIGPATAIATGDAPSVPVLLAVIEGIDVHEPLLTHDGIRRILTLQAET